MKRALTAALSIIITATNIASADTAQALEADMPIRAATWNSMPDNRQIGYAIGATQVAAYLAQNDAAAGCTAGLYDIFLEQAGSATSDDPIMFMVEDLAVSHCGESLREPGEILSSRDVSEVFTSNDDTWSGFVVGAVDYLHYRVYASFGEDAANCVRREAIQYTQKNPRQADGWTSAPQDPFVEQLINDATGTCQLG